MESRSLVSESPGLAERGDASAAIRGGEKGRKSHVTRHDRSARLKATCSPSRSFCILYLCVPFGCGNLLPFILVVLVVGGDLVVGLLLEGVALDHVLNEVRLVNGVAKALLPTHYALIVQQAAGGQRSRLLHQQENQKERERNYTLRRGRESPKQAIISILKKTEGNGGKWTTSKGTPTPSLAGVLLRKSIMYIGHSRRRLGHLAKNRR